MKHFLGHDDVTYLNFSINTYFEHRLIFRKITRFYGDFIEGPHS